MRNKGHVKQVFLNTYPNCLDFTGVWKLGPTEKYNHMLPWNWITKD